MITLFSWKIQGGYVPGLILDPDKGIEQAVYAKNKGIDYSYADTSGGIGNLGQIGTGKGKFEFFFSWNYFTIFFLVIKGGKAELNDAANSIDDCYKAIVNEFGEPPPEKPPKKPKPINLLEDFDDNASVATTATDTKSVIGNLNSKY